MVYPINLLARQPVSQMFLFKDPENNDPAVEPRLPPDVWEQISNILLREILDIPVLRRGGAPGSGASEVNLQDRSAAPCPAPGGRLRAQPLEGNTGDSALTPGKPPALGQRAKPEH